MSLLLGIDPGHLEGLHGWGLISCVRGAPCGYVESGHDKLPALLAKVAKLAPSLLLVAVETPVIVYGRGAQLAARAESLLSVAEAAGYLRARSEGLGVRAQRIAPEEWRRHLCSNASASDEVIAATVARLLAGVPKGRLSHENDALGTALAVALGWRPLPLAVRVQVAKARRQRREPRRPR